MPSSANTILTPFSQREKEKHKLNKSLRDLPSPFGRGRKVKS
jgi:hypothetical protein